MNCKIHELVYSLLAVQDTYSNIKKEGNHSRHSNYDPLREKENWDRKGAMEVPEKLFKLSINNKIKKYVDERLKHGTVICS